MVELAADSLVATLAIHDLSATACLHGETRHELETEALVMRAGQALSARQQVISAIEARSRIPWRIRIEEDL